MSSQYEKRKAKAKEVKEDPTNIPSIDTSIVYDRTAYDIFWDDEQRKFVRVIVEYDLTLGLGRVKETKAIADSQPVAVYKMGEAINRKVFNLPMKED